MFGAELWWKGEGVWRMVCRANNLQLLVNEQTRAITGAFRSTNQGALALESGLHPATAQLQNWQRCFGLRLLSLPEGAQGRDVTNLA